MTSQTTPTGIPIIDCATCGIRHAATRKHCSKCGSPSLFRDKATGLCIRCKDGCVC